MLNKIDVYLTLMRNGNRSNNNAFSLYDTARIVLLRQPCLLPPLQEIVTFKSNLHVMGHTVCLLYSGHQ